MSRCYPSSLSVLGFGPRIPSREKEEFSVFRLSERFDLKTDPRELRDLFAIEKPRAAELEAKLFAHFKFLGHDLTARRWGVGMNPVYNSQGKRLFKK